MNDLFVRLTECDFCRISYIKHIGHADCSSYASKVYLNTGEVLYSTRLPDDLVCEIDRINKNYNDNNLQQENRQLKERIDKAIEYINEAINYPRGCGLEPLDEIYAENIIDKLKGGSNE